VHRILCDRSVLRWRGWRLQDFLFAVKWHDVLAALALLVASAFVNALIWI